MNKILAKVIVKSSREQVKMECEIDDLKTRIRELHNELSIAQFQTKCQAKEIQELEERITPDANHPMSLSPAPNL